MGVKKNYSFIIFLRGGLSAADPLEKNYFTLVNNSFDDSLIARYLIANASLMHELNVVVTRCGSNDVKRTVH